MKKRGFIAILVVLVTILGFAVQRSGLVYGADATETGIQPKVVVTPSLAKLASSTNLVIMGAGFKAGQELYILLSGGDGVMSNIVTMVKPAPQEGRGILANNQGDFACLLTLGGLQSSGAEGVFTISVTDLNFNTLATAPVGFADPDGKSQFASYPQGKPDYKKNPNDPRPLPWIAPFFEYPKRP